MYRLSSEQDLYQYRDMKIEVYQNGEKVKAAVTYSTFMSEEAHEYSSTIEVASGEGFDYTHPNFEVHFILEDETIQLPFELKNEIKKTKTYVINEQLEIEGQKFTVKEFRISPLRVGIKLAINNHVAAPILHVSGALLLLTMSVKFATTYYAGSNEVLFASLGINCALWLLLGIWQKLIYFILAGGLGIALVVTYSFII